ncbi:MAG TPA: DUF488 domain-containing protein [Conexibacter sp.]|jgi:uncharacterized protein (DUF488 family)|nr:DUF488 domain-containing protein [Conexibacter sp.]
MPALWTIGYERLPPDALVAELEAVGVERVLDVRFRPQSRRPGMSKTKLGLRLGEHGIAYESRRTLGTPPEIRPLYRGGAVRQAADAFRTHLEQTAREELDALAAELRAPDAPRTALLCLEAEPAHCHRRVVAEQLRERVPELHVVDL